MDWSNWSDISTVIGSIATVLAGGFVGIKYLMLGPVKKFLERIEKRFSEQHESTDQRISDLIGRIDATDLRIESRMNAVTSSMEAVSSRVDARMNALNMTVEKLVYTFFRDDRDRN